DARRYRRYRSDLTLDVRDVEVTLRRLRTLVREGHRDELDLQGTLDASARAFGDLEIVLRARRRSGVRVLLLMDVGGSMEPHVRLCSQLFSAARRSSSLRELRTYYFHNVVYGKVFTSDGAMTPVDVTELLGAVNRRWKLVLLGDAQMAPGELLSVGPFGSPLERPGGGPMRGFDWLVHLAEQFDRTAWLNPDPPSYWVGGTVEVISQVFRMYQLSLDGLTRAFTHLASDAPEPRLEFRGNPRNAL
ncbi:MAG: VWA domain-containing protein, partial [Deltaproteobacteria bacterium]|nr:VWA domain-containing protein [Deltaproteobacteria bacterium]